MPYLIIITELVNTDDKVMLASFLQTLVQQYFVVWHWHARDMQFSYTDLKTDWISITIGVGTKL